MDVGASYRYGAPGSEFVTSLYNMFASIPDNRTSTKILDEVMAKYADTLDERMEKTTNFSGLPLKAAPTSLRSTHRSIPWPT